MVRESARGTKVRVAKPATRRDRIHVSQEMDAKTVVVDALFGADDAVQCLVEGRSRRGPIDGRLGVVGQTDDGWGIYRFMDIVLVSVIVVVSIIDEVGSMT